MESLSLNLKILNSGIILKTFTHVSSILVLKTYIFSITVVSLTDYFMTYLAGLTRDSSSVVRCLRM